MKTYLFIIGIMINLISYGQNAFVNDPSEAKCITSDIPRFWKAFDQMDLKKNPFHEYLKNGSIGLKDFIPNRIKSAKYLLKVVKKRKSDYEAIRKNSYKVKFTFNQIRSSYKNFKGLYDKAVFPDTYFVIGAFNSGGTASKHGLIIGVEMQKDIENIPYIVAHELIHFNQNYSFKYPTLLEQSIKEGSADFIGKIISGKNINEVAFNYGNKNEKQLCLEFVKIMNDTKYHGWLYGTKGKKKGRPNDLGYWIGYKICESYYNKMSNKKEAIRDILNINNFEDFLEKSGYLSKYIGN